MNEVDNRAGAEPANQGPAEEDATPEHHNDDGKQFHSPRTDRLARFQALVGALTLGAVVWYAWIARGQLEEMRLATRAALQSVELGHRAWVLPRGIEITGSDSDGMPATYQLALENSGHVPARGIMRFHSAFLAAGAVPTWDFGPERPSPFWINPGTTLSPFGHFTKEFARHWDAIKAEKETMWLLGDLEYEDLWGTKRRSSFSYYLQGQRSPKDGRFVWTLGPSELCRFD